MDKCTRCGKDVVTDGSTAESWQYGFKVGSDAYHCGCALLAGVSEPRKPLKFDREKAAAEFAKRGNF